MRLWLWQCQVWLCLTQRTTGPRLRLSDWFSPPRSAATPWCSQTAVQTFGWRRRKECKNLHDGKAVTCKGGWRWWWWWVRGDVIVYSRKFQTCFNKRRKETSSLFCKREEKCCRLLKHTVSSTADRHRSFSLVIGDVMWGHHRTNLLQTLQGPCATGGLWPHHAVARSI